MAAVLLDTHAWVWSFSDDAKLSPAARTAIQRADAVHVSPITFYEIGQKVRLGKWPEMEPHAASLATILQDQGGSLAPFTAEICLAASLRDWDHRDPFDRMIAATAEACDMALISADQAFAGLPELHVIW